MNKNSGVISGDFLLKSFGMGVSIVTDLCYNCYDKVFAGIISFGGSAYTEKFKDTG